MAMAEHSPTTDSSASLALPSPSPSPPPPHHQRRHRHRHRHCQQQQQHQLVRAFRSLLHSLLCTTVDVVHTNVQDTAERSSSQKSWPETSSSSSSEGMRSRSRSSRRRRRRRIRRRSGRQEAVTQYPVESIHSSASISLHSLSPQLPPPPIPETSALSCTTTTATATTATATTATATSGGGSCRRGRYRTRSFSSIDSFFLVSRNVAVAPPASSSACATASMMSSCRPAPHLVTGTLFGTRKGRMQLAIQHYAMALPGDRSAKKCGSSPNNPNPWPRLPLPPPPPPPPLMMLLDLAIQTSQLIVQMANGPVRIALECTSNPANPDRVITSDRTPPGAVLGRAMKSRSYGGSSHSSTLMGGRSSKLQELMVAEDRARSRQVQRRLRCEEELLPLVEEPTWIMYCNGRKLGVANGRLPAHADLQVLSVMQAVSMGAGILPAPSGSSAPKDGAGLADKHGDDDDILYIRSRFERVIGSNDCEAFYMMNPDGHGGPEISILLLRI